MPVTAKGFQQLFDVLMQINLGATVPPPPPYGVRPTWTKVKRAVDAGARLIPQPFLDGYVAPLQKNLKDLVKDRKRRELETLTGAVYQHAQMRGKSELTRFLAVVSDLFQSFLDKKKRAQAQFPNRERLPPLAMFQHHADFGPQTFPVDKLNDLGLSGATVSVVSLPAAYREHPFFWASLAHETGGHDVVHADPDLLSELKVRVRKIFRTSQAPLGLLWAYWMNEAAADAYAVLNMGPAFGLSLVAFVSALIAQQLKRKRPTLLTQSGPLDRTGALNPHPTDLLRLYLVIGAIEQLRRLSAKRKQEYIRDLKTLARICAPKATSIKVQGIVKLETGETATLDESRNLKSMQDAARQVGGFIVTARLSALGAHSIQDVETWDNPDEHRARQIALAISSGAPITDIGDDAQLLAGMTLAIFENPSIYLQATRLVDAGLDESFLHDKHWGQANT